jgi:Holliday junction resolvase
VPKAETRLVQAIIQQVKREGGHAVHLSGSIKQEAGLPDILGGLDGVPFLVEVKTSEGELSAIQIVQLQRWRQLGYCTGVVTSPKEFWNLIEEHKK